LWLHWLQPEDEGRDCDFCRKYEHYSFRNKDRDKAGKPIVEGGRIRERGRGDSPQCAICPAVERWTPDNLALYRRWRFRAQGVDRGPVDARTAWAFFWLDETAREIDSVRAARAANLGTMRAFGHG
jgi:hypothetical protein